MGWTQINSAAVSRVFRLAFVGVIAILLLSGYLILTSSEAVMRREMQAVNAADLAVMADLHSQDGLDALSEIVRTASQAPLGVRQIIGLFALDGSYIAGDIPIEPIEAELDNLSVIHEPGGPETVYIAARVLLPDAILIVGRPNRIIQETLRNLLTILPAAALAIMVALVLAAGFAARTLTRLLDGIETTLNRFSAGDQTARVPIDHDTQDRFHSLSMGINQNLGQIEETSTLVENTTTAIAHDLRRPLTRAALALQVLEADPTLNDATVDKLSAATGELEKLRQTFDSILRLSNISGSRSSDSFVLLDLHATLIDLADSYAPVLEDAGFTLQLGQIDPATIRADKGMIGQLVINLLGNVMAHCPKGTVARIDLFNTSKGVVLSVADTGPGVPDAALKDIFTPFRRLDPSRNQEGSGLGLALVAAIAKRHGAKVVATNDTPGLRVEVTFDDAIGPDQGDKNV